jgi:ribonuclease BN (tRNA processing enzyme)
LQVTGLVNVPVKHCRKAFAVVIDSAQAGWRLVYSGDCRPSESLVQVWV